MRTRAFLALAVVVAAAVPSSPRSADPRAALARAKGATGGARWDGIQTTSTRAKVTNGGLEGVIETWADVRSGRYASRFTLGPSKGGEGWDGKKPWTQDDSGQVRLEETGDAREGAADEAYRTALAYWFPERWPASIEDGGSRAEGDRRFDVVRIAPRGGRPFELWIDAATGLVDRFAERDATRVRTTILSDYREVAGGVRVPFAIRQTTGDPRYDTVFSVERVAVNEPLDEARLAPPAPPPPDFAIAGGATSATIPFQLLNDHIYVDVRLNGKGPFRFICDTGGTNLVTPEVLKELGIAAQGAIEVRGAGEKSEDAALAKVSTLDLGPVTLRDQLFYVYPFATLSSVEGTQVQGLVGYEVFKRFVVTIDYAGRKVVLHAPGTFRDDGRGVALPFRFYGHIPVVDGALDGVPGAFWLDTGSRGSLQIARPFAEQHALVKRYGATTHAVTGWGVGGPSHALLARARHLTLGERVEIDRPVIDISTHTEGGAPDRYAAGTVGGALLKQFTLTFDYARQQVTFLRNAPPASPMPYDRSGLWLNAVGGAFEVMDVVADGPGARAGVKVGDRVVAVDGKAAAKLSLPAVRERLRTDAVGTRIRLSIEARGARRDVTLVLADLV